MMTIFLGLVGIVLLAAAAAWLMTSADRQGDKGNYTTSTVLTLFGSIAGLVAVALGLALIIISIAIHAYGYKAQILNKEFGTNYTAAELFWAGDFITEIHRSRIDKEEQHGE